MVLLLLLLRERKAIKIMDTYDENKKEVAENELKIVRDLQHENVVK